MTLREKLIEALEQEVHDEYGYLAGAQNANLIVHYDSQVAFDGKGYIDLRDLVDVVIHVFNEVE